MTEQPSADDSGGPVVDCPKSVAACRTLRGATHILYADGGRLRDREVVTGRDRCTSLAADEVVMTPSRKVLVIIDGDRLTRASVLTGIRR